MKYLLLTAAISAVLAQGAFAQGSNTPNPAQSPQAATPLPQQIKQKLQSAGYSDVNIMPISFVVHAKDRQGDPVEIVITPHSMTQLTALNASEQNDVASGGRSNSTSGNQ
jgi:hypothetical protein